MESANVIERYELKYLIPERLVASIRDTARLMCKIDKHAGPDGGYLIRSLYMDSDKFDLYWANEREQADRFKLRVRGYPNKSAPVFLEVKRRIYDVIKKSRGAIEEGRWKDVLEGRAPPSIALGGASGQRAVEHFMYRMWRNHIRPKVLVEYEREAYESTHNRYARLTFDRKIRCQTKETLDLDADPRRWRPVDHPARTKTNEPVCVLELKFENEPPAWMVHLVKRNGLLRYAFSKYCYSVDAQLLLPERRSVGRAMEPRS